MPKGQRQVDINLARLLPKCELHAHLTGSISKECLHDIWVHKQNAGECLDLEDPMTAIKPGEGLIDVVTFFPLFDSFIYHLCNDVSSVKYATHRVLEDFERDGVRHLELRTTPRGHALTGLTPQTYVAAVCETIAAWNAAHGQDMIVFLILSVDRKVDTTEAEAVVDLAAHYHYLPAHGAPGTHCVVALDLCGNPSRGDPKIYTQAMARAKALGLGLTVHFAEVPSSSSISELEGLLSWGPDRLGHAIHIPPDLKKIIRDRGLHLELCLSCNVLAKLTQGGFSAHHFGEWYDSECGIALSTDDAGIFGSSLSHEYLLAAEHFSLGAKELIELSRQAAGAAFTGTERMLALIHEFEQGSLCQAYLKDSI